MDEKQKQGNTTILLRKTVYYKLLKKKHKLEEKNGRCFGFSEVIEYMLRGEKDT